jgi:hypothetical protein
LTIVARQGGLSPWSHCAIGRAKLGPAAVIDLPSETRGGPEKPLTDSPTYSPEAETKERVMGYRAGF